MRCARPAEPCPALLNYPRTCVRALVLFLLLLPAGCTSPDAGPCPVDLGRLAPILTDLHLAQGLSPEIPTLRRDSIDRVYEARILADYGMRKRTFDSLMFIVRREPVWIDSLYGRVGTLLARRELAY